MVTDIDGRSLLDETQPVTAPAQSSRCVRKLDLSEWVKAHEKRGLLVWLELASPGHPISRNLVFFARPVRRPRIFSPRPKHLDLSRDPETRATLTSCGDGAFEVALRSRAPALWVWVELDGIDARFSDNFFHLCAASAVTIRVEPAEELAIDALRERLIVRHLVDTYR